MRGPPRALVFDSGAGGLSIVAALRAARHGHFIDYLADTAWFPYGEKGDAALTARLPELLGAAVRTIRPDLMVVACNTASTLALDAIRAAAGPVPVVGVVPAIKPAAALSTTGVIGLLATPRTVQRAYTDRLVSQHAAGLHVLRHGPPDLAMEVERMLGGQREDPGVLDRAVQGLFGQPRGDRIDVVALACTHYPFVRDQLAARAPHGVRWIDSGEAVARRVGALLSLPPGAADSLPGAAWTTGGEDGALRALAGRFGFAAGPVLGL